MRLTRLAISAVLLAVLVAACGKPSSPLLQIEGQVTTSTSTSTPEVVPSTVLSPPTTVPAATTTTRRRTSSTSAAKPVTTTAPLKRLVLSKVVVGVGTPCEDADPNNIDGCFFFVQVPDTQKDVPSRLKSDRGYDAAILVGSNGCDQGATRPQDTHSCERYIGPVHGRTTGQTECFWLTTTDPAYESRSTDQCMIWSERTAVA